MWPLRALALDINFSVFGVPATVTPPPPDDVPVVTTGVWMDPTPDADPYGTQRGRRQPQRVMALQIDAELPDVKVGSIIVAPERTGDPLRTWRVEQHVEQARVDHVRVVVLPLD